MRHYRYHKQMRTTAERRANSEYTNREDREDGIAPVMCRPARKPRNIPHAYNDVGHSRRGKGWKVKGRKTQYYVAGTKGVKYTIELDVDGWRRKWNLITYFQDYDIPYRIVPKCKRYTKIRWQRTEYVFSHKVPVFGHYNWDKATNEFGDMRQRGWSNVFRERKLDKPIPKIYNYSETIGYTVIWWSKTELDVEKIMAGGH